MGDVPAGHRVVCTYAIMPSVESARMLLPREPAGAARILTAYNSLRHPRTRVVKRAGAVAFRLGLDKALARDRLTVSVPNTVSPSDLKQLLLVEHLRDVLPVQVDQVAVGVSAPAPNRKPTLQLFDASANPIAYVKVGWNDHTRRLVRHEAEVLGRPFDGGVEGLRVRRPELLYHGRWRGLELLATAPLPAGIRPQRPSQWPDPRIARALSAGRPWSTGPLAASAYLQDRLTEVRMAHRHGDLAEREHVDLEAYLRTLVDRHGTRTMAFGRWHGDYSPWNIGYADGGPWIWDWEFEAGNVPVGLDVVHYAFQRAFVGRGIGVEDALSAAESDTPTRLAALGPPANHTRVLVSLYLVEVLLRACRMHRHGAGWNERFRQGALAVLRTRLP